MKLDNYYIANAHGLRPIANLSIYINGEKYEASATGGGQYDAFMNARPKSTKISKRNYRNLPII